MGGKPSRPSGTEELHCHAGLPGSLEHVILQAEGSIISAWKKHALVIMSCLVGKAVTSLHWGAPGNAESTGRDQLQSHNSYLMEMKQPINFGEEHL